MQFRLVKHRGKWAVREAGTRKRRSLGIPATEANRLTAEQAAKKLVDGIAAAESSNTVDELMAKYISDKEERGTVDIERMHYAWKALASHFSGLTPDQIDRDTCKDYYARREADGVTVGTINKELRTLRAALRWSDRNTPAIVEVRSDPEPKDRWLTKEEFRFFIEETRQTFHLQLFAELAIATAARAEAILGLRWTRQADGSGYIDFDKRVIHMGQKKNGKKRATVPMTERIFAVLKQAEEVALTDHVVEHNGTRIKSIRHAFEKAAKRTVDKHGIEPFTRHDLRHTAAVWMAGADVPMAKISAYLGHSSIEITAHVYAKYQPDHLRDAANALEF
jgi:integrase